MKEEFVYIIHYENEDGEEFISITTAYNPSSEVRLYVDRMEIYFEGQRKLTWEG